MSRNTALPHEGADRTVDANARGRTHGRPTADVLVRNYDADRSYGVDVRLVGSGDEVALERTYRIGPGNVAGDPDAVEAGVYDVTVRTGGGTRAARRCRVDDDPELTVLVEPGNGVVSVSEGVY